VNDIEVNENCLKIRNLGRKLAELQARSAKGRDLALFITLSDIEMAARRAQDRLNTIDHGSDFKPPVEMMGT